MNETSLVLLLGAAAGAGAIHTATGIDHTLPFVLMARAERWSLRKLWLVTLLCGTGHIASSVALGMVGIGLGLTMESIGWIDSARGNVASWLLIGLGLAYAAWGVYRNRRNRPHTHPHVHLDGIVHSHEHAHHEHHLHAHQASYRPVTIGFLFVLLLLGPCEPLIPLLMVAAAHDNTQAPLAVTACFTLATLGTMLALVTLGHIGLRTTRISALAPYGHVLAGLLIAATGAAVRVIGL